MKKTKTILALAAMACSAGAFAAPSVPDQAEPGWHLGIENRESLVRIPVCAKADLEAGFKFIWTEDLALRGALSQAVTTGCFERLGREGDLGYAQSGVTLIKVGGNVYKSAIAGQAAGQALRALTAPKQPVKSPELTERVGVVSMSGFSATGNMTLHAVTYDDGSFDVIRRVGETQRIQPGVRVMVSREQLDENSDWLSISGRAL